MPNLRKVKLARVLRIILAVGLISSFGLFIQERGFFSEWENLITDSLFIKQSPPEQVLILGIDEQSLAEFGAWPWDRTVWSNIIDKLDRAGSRVVAFDVTFFEPRPGDDAFLSSLQESGIEVVLAGKLIEHEYYHPLDKFLDLPNVHTGYANFAEELDGKVRETRLFDYDLQQNPHYSLAYNSLRRYFATPPQADPLQMGFTELPGEEVVINYFGGAQTYDWISISDFLSSDYPDISNFDEAIVFVGGVVQDLKLGLDDNFITPTGSMPGVEIHANVAGTVLDNVILLRTAGPVTSSLMVMLVLVAFLIGNSPRRIFISIIGGILLIAVYFIVSLFSFGNGYVNDFLYTPLMILVAWMVGFTWQYILKRNENQGLKKAFSQYVNEKLLARILEDPSQLKLGGERRELTILFSDIRGFTSLSEQVNPEELVSILNDYLTTATEEILQNNGIVDKYLGDAIMAIWNAPFSDIDHPVNAIQAGIGMVEALSKFNKVFPQYPDLKVGIGINTGEAVIGNMGSEKRFDYTAIGDAVNLASRLEGLTKQYAVNIILGEGVVSELTKLNMLTQFGIRKLDKVSVKGKSQAMMIYQVFSSQPDSNQIKEYEQALDLYIAGDFESSVKLFEDVATKFSDESARIMAERCKTLKDEVELEWPGYWKWDKK